jgi:anion-transporting  ArsA/GET3 family ATPase
MKGAPELLRAIRKASVLVVAGPGGVGKTTTAAALAMLAAIQGRRALVCTIDPSRRLATSLGLRSLREKPRRLDLARAAPSAGGALYAMTLDTKHTFDELVARHASSDAARRRILENRFYKQVSTALAGSHEYMAMEKLFELKQQGDFDLVVLDTPPTRHALDFLEAPDRMLSFLDTSVLRYFLRPYFAAGRLTLKVATRTGALALKLADKALGLQFLHDLSEFFLAFDGMYDGFKERAAAVHALLRQASSGFVLVGSPQPGALSEVSYFHARLLEKGMPFVGFVVNRVHALAPTRRPSRRAGGTTLEAGLERRLLELYEDEQALASRERRAIASLQDATGEEVVLVAEQPADVHDLRGLAQIAQALRGTAR